jgi:hypothetical protein
LFAALLLTGCGGVPHRVHEGKVDGVIEQKSVNGEYVFAIGVGASDPALKTDTQRKALARDAAIVKAQFELLSYLKGVTLKGGVRVSRAMEDDSTIESFLHELIRGAEIVRSEFTADNGCVVTIRLPRSGLDGLVALN